MWNAVACLELGPEKEAKTVVEDGPTLIAVDAKKMTCKGRNRVGCFRADEAI